MRFPALYLGVDPGYSGALAWLDASTGELQVYPMPIFAVSTVAGRKRTEIDEDQLAAIIATHAQATRLAAIELVGGVQGQAAGASFNFGFATGCVRQAVASAGIRRITPAPQSWKRAMGVTADKDTSRREASRRWPQHAKLWPLVKHDGLAEAALLAQYAAQRDALDRIVREGT